MSAEQTQAVTLQQGEESHNLNKYEEKQVSGVIKWM